MMYKVLTCYADYSSINKVLDEINSIGATIEHVFDKNSNAYFIVKVSEKTEKSNRKKGDE